LAPDGWLLHTSLSVNIRQGNLPLAIITLFISTLITPLRYLANIAASRGVRYLLLSAAISGRHRKSTRLPPPAHFAS
jgi:hypothetical protein